MKLDIRFSMKRVFAILFFLSLSEKLPTKAELIEENRNYNQNTNGQME
jgi:hypothetical protein